MSQNETAKFREIKLSMQDEIFEKVTKGDGQYLRSVKKCFVCGKATEKGLVNHLEQNHSRAKIKEVLKLFAEKKKDFEQVCKELYQIHYFYLMQTRNIIRHPTISEKNIHDEMVDHMNRLYAAIYRDDEL